MGKNHHCPQVNPSRLTLFLGLAIAHLLRNNKLVDFLDEFFITFSFHRICTSALHLGLYKCGSPWTCPNANPTNPPWPFGKDLCYALGNRLAESRFGFTGWKINRFVFPDLTDI